ncbi:hypothetical protein [Sulfurimonas sp.]|uniref:hypothetical protein n=1 Tax=Sulfurimonas sp. TaxID=2022749 RepID=UPI0025FD325D|nr:hypothetical protein [Sulfurimonas sp.]MDD5157965.1 hypothetical protein [Sulfurimonas sp.]
MCENIALIKETHEHKSIKDAENEAFEMLQKIELGEIALKRVPQCNSLEIFFVMLIRALMTEKKRVIIVPLFLLTSSFEDMKNILKKISVLNSDKCIYILDLVSNKNYYSDSNLEGKIYAV